MAPAAATAPLPGRALGHPGPRHGILNDVGIHPEARVGLHVDRLGHILAYTLASPSLSEIMAALKARRATGGISSIFWSDSGDPSDWPATARAVRGTTGSETKPSVAAAATATDVMTSARPDTISRR